jgi:hypothetical protein
MPANQGEVQATAYRLGSWCERNSMAYSLTKSGSSMANLAALAKPFSILDAGA